MIASKKIFVFFNVYLLIFCLGFCLTGCTSLNTEFLNAAEEGLSVIVPQYCLYIREDSNLKDIDKEIRIKAAEELFEMVLEERERGGKND